MKTIQPLALFKHGNKTLNSIKVEAVKAFIIHADTKIVSMPTEHKFLVGIATIRGEPVPIINLDIWFGFEPLKTLEEYDIILFCEIDNKKFGLLVKEVIDIVDFNIEDFKLDTNNSPKISSVVYYNNLLALVLNTDLLLKHV